MSFLPDKMVVFALIFAVLFACPYEMVLEKKSVLWYNIYIYEHCFLWNHSAPGGRKNVGFQK